jgi:[glutamine synthetase] adenylyltransferase / [glutamine synthetase]-adenylyl-L-tyrosine phosphorylase
MKTLAWKTAVKHAADPARAQNGFNELVAVPACPAPGALVEEHARILAGIFSGSQAMTLLLLKHPEWVNTVLAPDALAHPRQAQGLRREVNSFLEPGLQAKDHAGVLSRLRQFKQREMLRIAARDLSRLGDTTQITRELSDVADVTLDTTLQSCRQQLIERLGTPYYLDAAGAWQPAQFCVLGLGKLGGQELNYSSDVDVIFVYSEEGHVFKEPPRKGTHTERAMGSHQFFKRLAEVFIAEISRSTADGMLHRIDLRLRPEGDAGPLARSLSSYENYYAQWGQTWERMMLIKARCVAGDAALASEFMEMIQPFRYPRSLNEGALREIAALKARIENEVVKSGEMDRNVKLGRGGIREIEFVVQTAQLLNAGRSPFLQGAQTLPTLQKLAQYQLLSDAEARNLSAAYCFLREVEHRVQMENDLQTHTIPADRAARERLARLMGFTKLAAFEKALKKHADGVRRTYEKFVEADAPEPPSFLPRQFRGAEMEWKQILAEHRFKDAGKSFRLLNEFANGPGFVHVSQRTTELAMQLVPKFLALCRRASERPGSKPETRNSKLEHKILSDPDRVLARLDSFITAYGARAMMFETWAANPQIFELLLLLFDRSEFLAEIAIRTPDLVDELVLSGRLRRSKSVEEILQDLRHGRDDADQRLWLRRYHQAEFMRIGLRGILGLADYEQNFLELSALADACLQYALDVALRKQKLKASPLVIIGLGKLGGRELNYGSDLDILFVADNGARNDLPKLQKIAVEIMDLLGSQTELGIAFATDARLRPDGEKGLLVNTLAAYEEYYRNRAQLWEIQALTRTRPVAGDMALGEKFQQLSAALTNFKQFAESHALPHPSPLPQERVREHHSSRTEVSRRVRSRQERDQGLPTDQALLRAPSPGGEGWGEGGPISSAASNLIPPACFTPGWKQQIAHMRARIEKERTPPGQDALAFKTGNGGVMDAEFIAQAMCLEHGWREPNTLVALQRIRGDKILPTVDADKLLDNYRQLRRLESILRRWSFEGEALLPAEPAPYYRVSVRCGFESPEAFRDALARWRKAIREIYLKVFAG